VRAPAVVGPYVARGVLWCRACGTAMVPALWRAQRVYRCGGCDGGTGRRVDALLVETELWNRLAHRRPAVATAVAGNEARHQAITRQVVRVEVADPYPMRVTWAGLYRSRAGGRK